MKGLDDIKKITHFVSEVLAVSQNVEGAPLIRAHWRESGRF